MRKGVKARCNTTIVVMRPIYSLQSVRFEVRVGDSSVFSISPHGPLIQIASSRSHFRFATKVLTKPFPSCKIHEDESTTSFFLAVHHQYRAGRVWNDPFKIIAITYILLFLLIIFCSVINLSVCKSIVSLSPLSVLFIYFNFHKDQRNLSKKKRKEKELLPE